MDVTDEMRRAVLGAECDRLGHLMDISEAISNDVDEAGENTIRVRAGTPGREPHLFCKRCDLVWIVVAEPGHGYDAAFAQYHASLAVAP